jgi:hypothetical protein
VRPDWRAELAFLAVPWKLAVFLPAIVFVAGHALVSRN